jgi:hypothetical protein
MVFTGTIPKGKPSAVKQNPINNGHWKFHRQMTETGCVGFIYVIRDTVLERFYLGKKKYFGEGVKNRGVESAWRKYKSSSNLLKEVMQDRPSEEFEYICLEEYKAKGALSYAETWTLCHVEAPTSVTWYNTRIEKVSWSVKEPISDVHKERLTKILSMEPMGE